VAIEALVTDRVQADIKALVKGPVEETLLEVLATYPDRAVVRAFGTLFTIRLAGSGSALKVESIARLPVKTVPRKQFVHDTMYSIVDALLTDQHAAAEELATQLLPMLSEATELLAYAEVPGRVAAMMDHDSPWKDYFGANKDEVVKTSGISAVPGAPKFTKLYDNSMTPMEAAEFDALVQAEFGEQTKEVETLWTTVTSLTDVLRLDAAAKEKTALAEDLTRHLTNTRDLLATVNSQVYDAAVLGRVSDVVASKLPSYKAFAAFLKVSI
jgi:hypothetical protein